MSLFSFLKPYKPFFIKALLLLFVTVVLYAITLYSLRSKLTEVPYTNENTILTINLSYLLSDSPEPSDLLESILELTSFNKPRPPKTFLSQIKAINDAKDDPRILGVLILGNTQSQIVTTQLFELREALESFKQSGKPILSYADSMTFPSYYVHSIADSSFIHPLGLLDFTGYASEQIMAGTFLKNLGIDIQILQSGKYKSGVEPFTLQEISKENREQTERLLNTLWDESLRGISKDKEVNYQVRLNRISNLQGFLSSQQAVKENLITDISTRPQFNKLLAETFDLEYKELNFITPYSYSLSNYKSSNHESSIAILYIDGIIVYGESSPGKVGHQTLIPIIRSIKDNEEIKTVILRINSPGGSAIAADLIFNEIQSLSEEKNVYSNFGNYAASGGYWIAMSSNTIYSSPFSLTGSIGVYGIIPNIQNLLNNIDIGVSTVKTNSYADINSIARPKTSAEMKRLQTRTNMIYDVFVSNVAANRNLTTLEVDAISQGRVWSGYDALKHGLIDSNLSLYSTITKVSALEKLSNYNILEYPSATSYFDQLQKRGIIGQFTKSPVVEQIMDNKTMEWVNLILSQDDHVYLLDIDFFINSIE